MDKFCFKWDGFQSSVTSLFDNLRRDGELVDVTLCCEGQRVRAHRMMLSACSPYFLELLKANQYQQMAIFLKDTSAADLSAIIEYMYKGSVNVSQSQLASFMKTAEMLQIRGLSGDKDSRGALPPSPCRAPPPPPATAPTPPHKRRRRSGGSAGGGRRSPVLPGRRPRTPTPPPAAPPPPPPPLPPPVHWRRQWWCKISATAATAVASAAPLSNTSDSEPGVSEQQTPPPEPAGTSLFDSVKVEPEWSLKDEDIRLDSTLCTVAGYEGAVGHAAEYEGEGGHAVEYEGAGGHAAEYDESCDGSNSGLDEDDDEDWKPTDELNEDVDEMTAGEDSEISARSSDEMSPVAGEPGRKSSGQPCRLAQLGAGPSQGPPGGHGMSPLTPGSQSGEDGSASVRVLSCPLCTKRYRTKTALINLCRHLMGRHQVGRAKAGQLASRAQVVAKRRAVESESESESEH